MRGKNAGWWALISLSVARSLQKDEEEVRKDKTRRPKTCLHPKCQLGILAAERELAMAQERITVLQAQLEAVKFRSLQEEEHLAVSEFETVV